MEELIFFAVLIFFSIIESIARSRKQRQGGGQLPELPDEEAREAQAKWEAEQAERSRRRRVRPPTSIGEEIAGLAREAKVELPAPRPKPRPRLPQTQLPQERRVPGPRKPAPRAAPARSRPAPPSPAFEGTPAHAVHLSHVSYGSDPSERARSAEDGLDPLARSLSADAAAVRRQLRGQGAHALRQALILQEVLGPPVASRPD
jgi:hypothetical protein